MSTSQAALATLTQRHRLSPNFFISCGLVLLIGAALMYWLEPGSTSGTKADLAAAAAEASRRQAASVQAAREREALARAAYERQAAEEAAERARREAMFADAASEEKARAEREELARRQAAVDAAHRSAMETEEAWKRFYRPSAACSDPSRSATVECVNEYVKAKREFASRQSGEAPR
jgi:hypothetical protein